jgi:hypothetical protein
VLPLDECTTTSGYAAAISYNQATLTVISPTVSTADTAFTLNTPKTITFVNGKEGDYFAITHTADCSGAGTNTVDSNQQAYVRQLGAGATVTTPNTLTATPLYACYATAEAYQAAASGTRDLAFSTIATITVTGGTNPTIVAGSTVAPTFFLATLISIAALFLARN